MKNNDVNININQPSGEKVSSIVKTVKSVTNTIANAKWTRIVKVYLVMFFFLATLLGGFFAYRLVSSDKVVDTAAEKMATAKEEENIRDYVVTPKIQRDIEILLYTLHADRVFIFEFHNGKKNLAGLPFKYADMSYEEANRESGIDRVYKKYQDVPLTMYKYPDYMHKEKIMVGAVSEIEKIDFEFAKCIKEDGGKYFAVTYLNGSEEPLGFLCISFHRTDNLPSDSIISEKIQYYGKAIGELLDLKSQMNKRK